MKRTVAADEPLGRGMVQALALGLENRSIDALSYQAMRKLQSILPGKQQAVRNEGLGVPVEPPEHAAHGIDRELVAEHGRGLQRGLVGGGEAIDLG
jgi:hypothetical protein